jgi:hypothetical protein
MAEGTVVDALLMTLGLDDKDFKRGQEETTKRTKEMRNVTKSASEDMAKSLAQVAKQFTLGALGVGSMVEAVRTFARVVGQNDQLGLLANNLGVNVTQLNALGNAAETAGGKSADINSALALINKEATQLRNFGPDAFSNLFRLARFDPLDPLTHQPKNPVEGFKAIGDFFRDFEAKNGRIAALNVAEQFGFTEGAFRILEQGTTGIDALIKAEERLGAETKKDADAARELDAAWTQLGHTFAQRGRDITTTAAPALNWFLRGLTDAVGGTTGGQLGNDLYDLFHNGGYNPNAPGVAHGKINRGGTVSDRNNNPGNLKPSGFSYPGQTGVDANGFAIFATPEAGRAALQGDLRAKFNRGDNTISSLITDYEGHDFKHNDIGAYIAAVSQQTGLGANQPFSADRLEQISRAITRQEGTSGFGGTNNTHSVDIGTIVINTQATDAAGIAADMNNQLQRKKTLALADGSSS